MFNFKEKKQSHGAQVIFQPRLRILYLCVMGPRHHAIQWTEFRFANLPSFSGKRQLVELGSSCFSKERTAVGSPRAHETWQRRDHSGQSSRHLCLLPSSPRGACLLHLALPASPIPCDWSHLLCSPWFLQVPSCSAFLNSAPFTLRFF